MFTAVVAITVLFVGLLAVKGAFGVRVCALCGAVSGTWIGLLGLYHTGYYTNEVVVALLLGQSVVGVLYALRDRVPERFEVFSLPFLLAGTVLAYSLLVLDVLGYAIGAVAAVWLLAVLLYTYRESDRVSTLFDEVVACCRDW